MRRAVVAALAGTSLFAAPTAEGTVVASIRQGVRRRGDHRGAGTPGGHARYAVYGGPFCRPRSGRVVAPLRFGVPAGAHSVERRRYAERSTVAPTSTTAPRRA